MRFRLRPLTPLIPFALLWIVIWCILVWALAGTKYWTAAVCVGYVGMMLSGQWWPRILTAVGAAHAPLQAPHVVGRLCNWTATTGTRLVLSESRRSNLRNDRLHGGFNGCCGDRPIFGLATETGLRTIN